MSACRGEGTALQEGLGRLGGHPLEHELAVHALGDEAPHMGLH